MKNLYAAILPKLRGISLLALLLTPAGALAAEPLAPRGEVSVKGGTDRSLLTTEFWAPLAQKSDRVLYGDVRLMGDNDENREGNLGVGYRQIKNDAVLGVHSWIDRRRTQHNSTFHQLTFGVERLGHIVDVRANVYIPLNQGRTIITPNIGMTTPYLAGSGIYYDTNGSINETPQYGVDGELGYRIPVLQKQVDAIRVYGGGYYFFRDNTVEVPGARFRTEAQINKIVSVGARVQYDKPRGTQGFLEATLKFPFSAKRLYQKSGIRSRLDESPERDVDIVTDSKVDTGLFKPVINTTSDSPQRILYVDNTKADGGDGSYEKPFNNLKAAEAALQANDILYVNRGDGTTRNMDQGIVIDRANVQMIGSGTALTYGGYTLLNAGAAPVITNTATYVDDLAANIHLGNGIYITAGDVRVTGLSITGAGGRAIYALAQNGQVFNNLTLDNINASSTLRGIIIEAHNSSRIDHILMDRISMQNDVTGSGISVSAFTNSYVNTARLSNITSIGNTGNGIIINAHSGSRIDTAALSDITVRQNTNNGIHFIAQSTGTIGQVTLANATATNNTSTGILFQSDSAGSRISRIQSDNTQSNNNARGISVQVQNAGIIENAAIASAVGNSNTLHGIYIAAQTAGVIEDITIANATGNNNNMHGTYVLAETAGGLNNLSINNISTNNNLQRGIYVQTRINGRIGTALVNTATINNNVSDGFSYQADTTSTIGTADARNINASGNLGSGLVYIANGGTITNALFSTITSTNNGFWGAIALAQSAGVINNVTMNNITANGSTTYDGVNINAAANSTINNATLNNIVTNNNFREGIRIEANGANAAVNRTEVTNATTGNTTGNQRDGLLLFAASGGRMSDITISNVTANNNKRNGVSGLSWTNGTMTNQLFSNIVATNNVMNGVSVQSTINSTATGVVLSGITANNNTQLGVNIIADSTATLTNVSLSSSTMTGNAARGLGISRAADSTLSADIGGGAFGSTGQNRIFGNTTDDIRVDRYALTATNNWWGSNAAPTRVTLANGGTLNATPFLATDPRP